MDERTRRRIGGLMLLALALALVPVPVLLASAYPSRFLLPLVPLVPVGQ